VDTWIGGGAITPSAEIGLRSARLWRGAMFFF
jgi:hypothetical protein